MRTRRPIGARSGFSLLEVMVSLSLLAVIMSGVMATFSMMQSSRNLARQQETAAGLARLLSDRLRSVNWIDLKSATGDARWTQQRRENGTNWLSEDVTLPDNRVLQRIGGRSTLGVLDEPTGLRNLKVYIEYYRALSLDLANPGMLDSTNKTKEDYKANRAGFLLDDSFDLQDPKTDPRIVLIRILVTYDTIDPKEGSAAQLGTQRVEIYTAKVH